MVQTHLPPAAPLDDQSMASLDIGPKYTKAGKPAQRRGPKPDSKPATNEKQAKNRCAQRLHRERREQLHKEMEENLLRTNKNVLNAIEQANKWKATAKATQQTMDSTYHENDRLKQLLQVNKIEYKHLLSQNRPSPVEDVGITLEDPPADFALPVDQRSQDNVIPPTTYTWMNPTQAATIGLVFGDYTNPYLDRPVTKNEVKPTTQESHSFNSALSDHTSNSMSPFESPPTTSQSSSGPTYGINAQLQSLSATTSNDIDPQSMDLNSDTRMQDTSINTRQAQAPNPAALPPWCSNPDLTPEQVNAAAELAQNFVIRLEKICHAHAPFLDARRYDTDRAPTETTGHALMLSSIPVDWHITHPNEEYPHQAPDVPLPYTLGEIERLGRSSFCRGEISPMVAYMQIKNDVRNAYMTEEKWERLTVLLERRPRCYGFGAALQESEVNEALRIVHESG